MRTSLKLLIAGLAVGFAVTAQPRAANAVSYDVAGGILLGVNGLNIPGLGVFNVAFADGTCANTFTQCGGTGSASRFSTRPDALAAMGALVGALIDTPLGLNTPPATAIFGTTTTPDILTPFDLIGGTAIAIGKAITTDPTVTTLHTTFVQSRSATLDTTGAKAVWAKFAAVPLPLPGLLLGAALVGVYGFASRRRRI